MHLQSEQDSFWVAWGPDPPWLTPGFCCCLPCIVCRSEWSVSIHPGGTYPPFPALPVPKSQCPGVTFQSSFRHLAWPLVMHDPGSWAQVLLQNPACLGSHTFSRSFWRHKSFYRSPTGPLALQVLSAPGVELIGFRQGQKFQLPTPAGSAWEPFSFSSNSYAERVDGTRRPCFCNLSAGP